MKVSIYDEKPVKKEQEFLLKLEQHKGNVDLMLVNPNGTPVKNGTILSIKRNMKLIRFICLGSTLGLPLNVKGQLKEVDE